MTASFTGQKNPRRSRFRLIRYRLVRETRLAPPARRHRPPLAPWRAETSRLVPPQCSSNRVRPPRWLRLVGLQGAGGRVFVAAVWARSSLRMTPGRQSRSG